MGTTRGSLVLLAVSLPTVRSYDSPHVFVMVLHSVSLLRRIWLKNACNLGGSLPNNSAHLMLLREFPVLGDAKESIKFRKLIHLLQDDRE